MRNKLSPKEAQAAFGELWENSGRVFASVLDAGLSGAAMYLTYVDLLDWSKLSASGKAETIAGSIGVMLGSFKIAGATPCSHPSTPPSCVRYLTGIAWFGASRLSSKLSRAV